MFLIFNQKKKWSDKKMTRYRYLSYKLISNIVIIIIIIRVNDDDDEFLSFFLKEKKSFFY